MRQLNVQFVPRTAVRRSFLHSLTATLVFFSGTQLWHSIESKNAIRACTQKVEGAARELASLSELSDSATDVSLSSSHGEQDVLEVEKLATFSFQEIFDSLEAPRVPGINLVSLDIDATNSEGRAEVRFIDFTALLFYVDQLGAKETSARWDLVTAQSSSGDGKGAATLRFRLAER